jgi:oligopeptide/dipeptide ABC transporter ATP-binding protein
MEVMRHPQHPYTVALLESVPEPGRPLVGLSGRIPDLIDYPVGCPYRSRCRHAVERCGVDAPEMRPIAEAHEVSCHLVEVERPTALAVH